MISGKMQDNDRATERVEGVRDALEAAGIYRSTFPVVEVNYSLEAAGRVFEEIVNTNTAPTAIICGNDVLAAGAVLKAKELGLKVPDDISILGYDDIELASVIDPKLTTVHVPHRRMGAAAAQCLINMRAEPDKVSGQVFQTEIIERESLGAPKV